MGEGLAIGKTPKPLRILVTDPTIMRWKEIDALQQQEHYVAGLDSESLGSTIGWDLVIGPNCWRMDEHLRPFLDLAIKEARARVYAKHATL